MPARLHNTFAHCMFTAKLTFAIVWCAAPDGRPPDIPFPFRPSTFSGYGRSAAAARRPPYFWAENDGKKKEGDATERERESGGAVTFTDGLKKD